MSKETFDPTLRNHSGNKPFDEVLEANLSRRSILKGGVGVGALTAVSSLGLSGCFYPNVSKAKLNFESIPGSQTDAVVVPPGYNAQILAPWGTPLNAQGNAWLDDGSNTAKDQLNAMGMHHDGMHFFPLNNSDEEGLLCINHEYIDLHALHPNGPTVNNGLRTLVDEVRKEINAHGVSVVRIRLEDNKWVMINNDPLNRRYTGATEMDVSGPLANTSFLLTKYSSNGNTVRGTLNNCGNGYTPWGTYLTCEENWPGYFVNTGTLTKEQARIGVSDDNTRYLWETLAGNAQEVDDEFTRFNVTPSGASASEDYRNEANGHGYIVEIDPYTANSRARKRTALGRFRHEGCVFGNVKHGKPVVFYSGHDSRFEYIYKFESAARWNKRDARRTDRLTVGDKYMDEGTLYVARFNDDGTGTWLPLTLGSVTTDGGTLADHFDSLEAIILNTPGAADKVGATPMDRPEWCAVDPFSGSAYMTLTNNTRRTEGNSANPRVNNKFGHIIRWDEGHRSTEFTWDIFVFGAPADGDADTNRSGLTEFNQFASPDGLAFDKRGIMWIQTDNGADEVEEYTNDQMLAVVPSPLMDDAFNQLPISEENQGELRRFFVGPNGCEVTGFAVSPDYRSVFVNIQHPRNWPYSDDATEETPGDVKLRPRAATVVIRRNDGGPIGT